MKKLCNAVVACATLWMLGISIPVSGENNNKKPLDHSVYDKWETVGGCAITPNGRYVSYYNNKEEGDGALHLVDLKQKHTQIIARGARAKFVGDKYLVFVVRPFHAQQKEVKIKKLKGDKIPKDTLAILELATGKLDKFPYLSKMELPKEGEQYMAFQARMMNDSLKTDGVFIYDFAKRAIVDTLRHLSSFSFNPDGSGLALLKEAPKAGKKSLASPVVPGVYYYLTASRQLYPVLTGNKKNSFTNPAFSEDGKAMAFYANLDSTKKFDENVEIYVAFPDKENCKATRVIYNGIKGLPQGWRISKNRSLNFNAQKSRLFFGIAPILPEKDTTLKETAKLDIWHYNDKYIQPQQLSSVGQELKKSYLSVIDLNAGNEIIQLATEDYTNVRIPVKWSADWGYSLSDEKYAIQSQWDANPMNDLYIISLKDGSAKCIRQGEYISSLKESPDGKYLAWYNPEKRHWFSYNVLTGAIRNISEKITWPLWNELHDTPQMASAYGSSGWREGEKGFFINDAYDVWELDPDGVKEPVCLTNGKGRELGYTFRILRTDQLQLPAGTPGIKEDPIPYGTDIWFTAFDNKSKGYGYFIKEKKKGEMKQLIMEPEYTLGYLNKAKNSPAITFVKSNFVVSPDVWVTYNQFKTAEQLSHSNLQQSEYNWGTCEMVYWKGRDGRDIEGLLYKPENFDPAKKYPMVVYFYEKTSQYKNMYRKPALSKSTINVAYFVSNGYLVFMPDIHYITGHPGQSAMNCIIPGVEKLCENNWVDRQNIAIQGQSWGGYQVAYLVTQTDMFKCASAGAPVANMTSAYGGIRWGSGVVRHFQYEHTQSRIGCTPWDKGGFDLYIENSPLFFADKVNTPLLIMHNDKDEAVPWYQGIEYFTALRRLGKTVWMLQYNNESHNISDDVNARDFTIRLSQFMDHYLKGAPMPVWMKKGVPASRKGIEWGLELVPGTGKANPAL